MRTNERVMVEPISTGLLDRQTRARLQFLTWLSETFPELYAAASSAADSNANVLAGLGQNEIVSSGTSWWEKLAGAATVLGTTYLGLKNQRDILKINLERAQRGEPPISGEDLTAPVIQTRIELQPETIDKLTAGAGAQINKMLLFGAAAIVAIMLFMRR